MCDCVHVSVCWTVGALFLLGGGICELSDGAVIAEAQASEVVEGVDRAAGAHETAVGVCVFA